MIPTVYRRRPTLTRTRPDGRLPRSKRRSVRPWRFESLEDRMLLSVVPNDPLFAEQWGLHNTGQTDGTFDADIDVPAAWSVTTGSMATVVAVLDAGVNYAHEDLYLNIFLNQGEIPTVLASALSDADADGLITFRDLNDPANAIHVNDLNATGYIDGGDLLADPAWENGIDEDGNGLTDDLVGWDFHDNDNDPRSTTNHHGTRMAGFVGAITDDGVGIAGVNWYVQLMPVRTQASGTDRDINNAAAGLDYAVAEGATISNNSWGDNTFSQVMFDAIDRARTNDHLVVAAAGNQSSDTDTAPFYPASYDLDNVIAVAAVDLNDELTSASNFGLTSVDLAGPGSMGIQTDTTYSAGNGTSAASAHVTGVAALVRALYPTWTYAQTKSHLMDTADPLPSLAGKTVSGGRVNAATAVSASSIHVSDPSIEEGDTGTTDMVFTVSRLGDTSGSLTLDWSTADGTATAASGDYVAASGQVSFAPGVTEQIIAVLVNGDTIGELDETFFLNLSNPSGPVTVADPQALGTIQNLVTTTHDSTDVPKNLEDKKGNSPGVTTSTLTVPDSATIVDINVQLDISHTWDADLAIFLISSAGTRVELLSGVGGSGDDFSGTTLDDEAVTAITAGAAPFSGSFQPEGLLSDFDGEDAAGTWTLEITDNGRRDTGTLNTWSITVVSLEVTPTPGITVAPPSGLTTTEAGGADSFTVVLDTQPTGDVTIGISSNNPSEGTPNVASLTFTPVNWDTPQMVTVTGVDDALTDGDVAYAIVTAAATSTDPAYNGLDASDVSVTNLDNEVPAAVTVTDIVPDTMSADSSGPVTINGSGFVAGASVTFTNGSGPAPSASGIVVAADGLSITATVSTHKKSKASSWDVVVANPDASSDACEGCFTVTVGGASSAATLNVVTVSASSDTDEALATTGDTSAPATTSDLLPAGDIDPLLQPAQTPDSGTIDDADLVDLVFSNPATLEDPLLDELAMTI